ncbi:MAG: pyrimidine 5'-nucleotidase [Saprospiraceae bacterium]|nr:pyrimidine 5'-nucleotidase [Saprospiraceae bacterium]
MKYKWLLFDADNTLFDFTFSQRKALENSFDHYNLEYKKEIFDEFVKINFIIWSAYDRNEITHEEIKSERFSRLFSVFGVSGIDLNEFNDYFISQLILNSKLLDGAEEILTYLHGKTNVALITNGMKEVQRPRYEQCQLKHIFNKVFISGEMGISKPNFEYFRFVHEETGNFDKGEYLVVGDNLIADVKGGKDYGFHTCWYNIHNVSSEEFENADYVINSLNELIEIVN